MQPEWCPTETMPVDFLCGFPSIELSGSLLWLMSMEQRYLSQHEVIHSWWGAHCLNETHSTKIVHVF